MRPDVTRRGFLKSAIGSAAAFEAAAAAAPLVQPSRTSAGKLAVAGGTPVRTAPFPSWPVIADNEEKAWMGVLRSRKWNRLDGGEVAQFESVWASRLGARHCLATANGTSALVASLNALGVGPGDEVVVPPYTFVATINVVLMQHALPVFVDTDPETMQIDARKIEGAITGNTRCIIPVHLGGSAADLDTILEIGRRRRLPVLEDACQAHFGEWRNRKLGTLGTMGCFSFQASKNLNSGEGGALVTDAPELYDICSSFHNQGRAARGAGFSYARNGDNRRMTEFQGALLLEQLTRLEQQTAVREQNAARLTRMLSQIPGITPAKMYGGCTRNAYHLYMFRYDKAHFSGVSRQSFLRALAAEGIPCSGGYTPLTDEPFLKTTLTSRGFRRIYPAREIDGLFERNRCPANDKLCDEAVWFTQNMLLGPSADMDQIAEAVQRIQQQSSTLVSE